MRRQKALALILVFAVNLGDALGGTHPKALPVSKYMRKVGLLYLQDMDRFEQECETGSRRCDEVLGTMNSKGEWDRTFDQLNDEVSVDIDEGGRPAGDKPYFLMLRYDLIAAEEHLEAIRRAYHNAERGIPYSPSRWTSVYAECRSQARSIAIDGWYADDVGCVKAVKLGVDEEAKAMEEGVGWDAGMSDEWKRKPAIVPPPSKYSGKEAEARSFHTQPYCEKNGFVWGKDDGICHASGGQK